jgi:hypothetical protein
VTLPGDEYWLGMDTPTTFDAPSASTAMATTNGYNGNVYDFASYHNDSGKSVSHIPDLTDEIVEKNWPETLIKDKAEEEKHLPSLPNVGSYLRVVTRFSPNPDCVLHLGSARAIILCYEYAKRIWYGVWCCLES